MMSAQEKSMKSEEKASDDNAVVRGKSSVKKRFVIVLFEVIAICFFLCVMALSFFIWRLTDGPIDIAFAKSAIQEALYDPDTGARVDFDHAVLHWPDLQGPLLLGLTGGRIYNGDDNLIVAIDSAALSLNKAKLLLGRISPEGLIIKKPSILLKRSVNNEFSIGLTSDVEAANDSSVSSFGAALSLDKVMDIIGRPNAKADGRLSTLKLVQVEDARVLIDDMVLSRSWRVPRVDFSLMREVDGVRSRFDVDLPRLLQTPNDIVSNVEGDVFAGWDSQQLNIESVLSDFDLRFLSDKIPELAMLDQYDVRLDAKMSATLGDDFSLRRAEVVLFSEAGNLNIPEFSSDLLPYQNFGVKAHYDADNKRAEIESLKVTAKGVTFDVDAVLTHVADGFSAGFDIKGRARIPALEHAQIAPLWPQALDEDNAKIWIVDKISDASFQDVYADFTVAGVADDAGELSIDLNRLEAGFDFKNLTANYRAPLEPVKKGVGKGVFDYKSETIRIDVSSAKILDLDIPKGTLTFKDIMQKGKGKADIKFKVQGPLKSALVCIKKEPIEISLDTDIDQVRGAVDLDINMQFPTKNNLLVEDMKFDVSGSLKNITLPRMLKDLSLTGGPYALSVKGNNFKLSGKGKLADRDITLEYNEFLDSEGQNYSSKVDVSIRADDDLRKRLGIDLSDFLVGPALLKVNYTKKNDGSAIADVTADLSSARFFVDSFDYEKAVGQAGDLSLKAHLKNDVLTKITALKVSAPSLSIEPSSLAFRNVKGESELSAGKISRFKVGESVGRIEFEILDTDLMTLALDGAFLDLRPFLNDDGDVNEQDDAPPMQISVSADTMRTSDVSTVENAKIYADIDGEGRFNQVEFDAIAGGGDVYMRFKPDANGKRSFRLEADDAGATLKAFDLYDNVIGGKLIIYGEPVRWSTDRNLVGKAEMSDFKVVKAPGLARVIGAMSLPGASEMLAGDGLSFTKLQADFDWVFRPDGSLLVVKDGRTSGNSMGLTFAGTFDNAANKIDIGGTIIPLSGINNMLKDIPLVGNILGGASGLFAATYKIKGDGKDPSVSVNPLSVLAPGIFRSILFESAEPSIGSVKKSAPPKVPHVAE